MQNILEIEAQSIMPGSEDVLRAQGIMSSGDVDDRIIELVEQAGEIFNSLRRPMGMFTRISRDDFREIYTGSGRNDHETPVADIFPNADHLSLFAVTVGVEVSLEINRLFAKNDFALAAMLDSFASEAVENYAQIIQNEYHSSLIAGKKGSDDLVSMRYSPGYCGWHISGQKKLFEYLQPGKIGISLSDTFLMQPLKSISGVILTGDKKIHIYEDNYPCCESCKDRSCLQRIERLKQSA
jgi:hypothetical protein